MSRGILYAGGFCTRMKKSWESCKNPGGKYSGSIFSLEEKSMGGKNYGE